MTTFKRRAAPIWTCREDAFVNALWYSLQSALSGSMLDVGDPWSMHDLNLHPIFDAIECHSDKRRVALRSERAW